MAITAATPMTMPSIVKMERILLTRSARIAIDRFMIEAIFMMGPLRLLIYLRVDH